MGCCASTPRRRSETGTPPLHPARQTAPPSAHAPRVDITNQPIPRAQVFNNPLRPHFWPRKSGERTWTQTALDRERASFWDTAITNRAEIWASLHVVCDDLLTIDAKAAKLWPQVMPNAGTQNSGGADDLPGVKEMKARVANAQAIIDAAGITLPSGDLVDGAYDGFGNHYSMPVWVVCNPEEIRSEAEGRLIRGENGQVIGMTDGTMGGVLSREEVEALGREGLEGVLGEEDWERLVGRGRDGGVEGEKEVLAVEEVAVKCRLTDGRQDVVVKIPKDAKVGVLAKKLAKVAEAKIRLAYLGKMLDPTEPLIDQGWQEGNVVSAMVLPPN